MKIASWSDIHEDINRKQAQTSIMSLLDRWIRKKQPEEFYATMKTIPI